MMLANCEAVIYVDNINLLYVHYNVYHILEALQWELISLMPMVLCIQVIGKPKEDTIYDS